MAEKKMGTQTKASMRNGRAKKSGEVYNANHNTLEKTRRGQLHIDETKFELNRYYQFNLPGKRGKVHHGVASIPESTKRGCMSIFLVLE